MKIEYEFVTGENVSIEVCGGLEEIMLELDKNIKDNSCKETGRHESLELFDKDGKNADITADIIENVCRSLGRDKLYATISKLKPQNQELIHNFI